MQADDDSESASATLPAMPQIAHVMGYGSSSANGAGAQGSWDLVSRAQPYANLRLNTGVRKKEWDNPSGSYTAFVPAIETYNAGEGKGETGVVAACNYLTHQLGRNGWRRYPDQDVQFLASSAGQDGAALSPLFNLGNNDWLQMIAMVTAAKSIATGLGKSYGYLATLFLQQSSGEYDSSAADHLAGLVDGKPKIDAAVAAIDGWTAFGSSRPFITMQSTVQMYAYTSSLTAEWRPNSALAVRTAAATVADFYNAGPQYIGDYGNLNSLHCVGNSNALMGLYLGKALDKVLRAKGAGTAVPQLTLEIDDANVAVSLDGLTITAPLKVPSGRVVVDTSWCAAAPNYGLDIFDGSGGWSLRDIITGVAVDPAGILTITTSAPVVPGTDLLCAGIGRPGTGQKNGRLVGVRTNLRDQDGRRYRRRGSDGVFYDLHNWLAIAAVAL